MLRTLGFTRAPYPEAWTRPYFRGSDRPLAKEAAKSSLWLFGGVYSVRILQIGVTAVLARILTPEAFGLYGMGMITADLIRVFTEFGMGAAVIYRQDINHVHMSTCFWFNFAVGVLLCAVGVALSPLAAAFFRTDAVAPVVVALSLLFLIEPLGSIQASLLRKRLAYRTLSLINGIGAIIRFGVTLVAVLAFELGHWALVVGFLIQTLVSVALRIRVARWWPSRLFDREAFSQIFRYGVNFFLNGVLHYLWRRSDYLVTGRVLGARSFGIYTFAFDIPHAISREFSRRLTGMMFPVFARVSHDRERFERGYLRALRFISLVSFPACLGLWGVAEHFVWVLYGSQWVEVIEPLRVLCFAALASSVLTTMGAVFNAKGRPDIEVKWNAVFIPVTVVAVWFAAGYGLLGVAAAMTAMSYCAFIAMWICMRVAEIPFRRFLAAIAPAFVGSALMATGVELADRWWLTPSGLPHWQALAALVALGVILYAAWLLAFQRATLRALIDFIRGGLERA